MNLEPPAQLPSVHSLLHRKPHKFTPLFHNRHLAPRHGWPPLQPIPCNDDVSVMSPNTRRGCPRAIQQVRPSRPENRRHNSVDVSHCFSYKLKRILLTKGRRRCRPTDAASAVLRGGGRLSQRGTAGERREAPRARNRRFAQADCPVARGTPEARASGNIRQRGVAPKFGASRRSIPPALGGLARNSVARLGRRCVARRRAIVRPREAGEGDRPEGGGGGGGGGGACLPRCFCFWGGDPFSPPPPFPPPPPPPPPPPLRAPPPP